MYLFAVSYIAANQSHVGVSVMLTLPWQVVRRIFLKENWSWFHFIFNISNTVSSCGVFLWFLHRESLDYYFNCRDGPDCRCTNEFELNYLS